MPKATQGVAFTDAATARVYALAGDAGVILRSGNTGIEFTYKITAARKGGHYVLLETNIVRFPSASDNPFAIHTEQPYLGRIDGAAFTLTKNSQRPADDPAVRAFSFFWKHLSEGRIPEKLEVRHTGRCGACGRKLRTQESILDGIGPECGKKLALRCA